MMKKNLLAVPFLMALAACTTGPVQTPNVPVVDSPSDPPAAEVPEPSENREQQAVVEPEAPAVSPVKAREQDQKNQEVDAVRYLLDAANAALSEQDFSRARALADRALRITRSAPRAYLVLARIAEMRGKSEQAWQLARRGLLYTAPDSEVGLQLTSLVARSKP